MIIDRYLSIIFIIILCLFGCEIKNNSVEITSLTASSSEAIPGETIKLYCEAVDTDGDKLVYNWDANSGTLSVNKDTALWTAPMEKGFYHIACKVSDGIGASDAALITIGVCDLQTIDMSEINTSEWNFIGSANWDATTDILELTPAQNSLVGTAFNIADTVSGYNVEISFQFYIGDGSGADGLTLTALDVDRMTTFLGETGGGIGYGGLPGWTIEVDTYFNGVETDSTSSDHVMFTFDGDESSKLLWSALPEMEDTGWHLMEVKVNAPHIMVSIDQVVYLDANVDGWYDFNAVVGFTAGTGGLTNRHLIRGLTVSTKGECK